MRRNLLVGFLIIVLIVVSGSVLFATGEPEPPTLTVENQDNATYFVTAYAFSDPDDIAFRGTTDNQSRRMIGRPTIYGGYRNITAVNEERSSGFSVSPRSNVTRKVSIWNSSVALVYIIETADGNESVLFGEVVNCERGGQEHRIAIANGGLKQASFTCSSSLLDQLTR
jgi:hypothetical protein